MWTSEQVQQNCLYHGACAEGLNWAAGKDLDAIWSTNDVNACSYLVWWAIKNAGEPGWATAPEIISVLTNLIHICCQYNTVMVSSLHYELSLVQDDADFKIHALGLYEKMKHDVNWESRHNTVILEKFQTAALAEIKKLRPSI